MLKDKNIPKNNWFELMAQKLAEVRLSEVGFRFVPGVFPAWRRVKQIIESRGRIVKTNTQTIEDSTPEGKMCNSIINGVREFEERSYKNAKNNNL
ncbi:hypothetical protein ACFL2V_16260 [Pseudomonadota bacterium]